jgi:RAMP superfamily protein
MNPYDFVRVDWNSPPQRRPAKPHHQFNGLSGRIEATLTAETQLFLKRGNTDAFFMINGKHAIAGSSLKGLFRSVVETVAQGCFRLFDKTYERNTVNYTSNLPNAFAACAPQQNVPVERTPLCPSCRLFGLIGSRRFQNEKATALRLGNVGFEDATCTHAEPHAAIYTDVLSSPKPHHSAFYLNGNKVAGRKFYFHYVRSSFPTGWIPNPNNRQNQFIRPLGAGSTFTFAAEFVNVNDDDLAALLYAMTLERGGEEGTEMRHKFGYAKPCGLGSVHIQITKLILRDPAARYRQSGGKTEYQDTALTTELNRRVAPFIATIPAITRADLRRIWQWPPAPGVAYRYPTQGQFAAHPNDPILTTDNW